MSQPYDYFGLMGGSQTLDTNGAVQRALFNGQQIEAQRTQLDQQAAEQQRADAAREAAARITMTPDLDDGQFEMLLQPIAQADPNAAAQLRRQRTMQHDLRGLLANPSASAIARFGIAYPDQVEPLQKGWNMLEGAQRDATLKTNADVYALLNAGDTGAAKAVLEAHEAADKAAGLDVSHYAALGDLLDSNPEGARVLAGMSLSTAMGHEKFADTYGKLGEERRADELQPAKVREAEATATTKEVEAQFAPETQESKLANEAAQRERWAAQTANEIVANRINQGRLELDQDKLETETRLKLRELNQTGTTPDAGSIKLINDAAGESVASQQSAQMMRDMAGKFRALGQSGVPAFTNTAEWFKRVTGNQNAWTQLRNEFTRLQNSEALKMRSNMPGAMSDADRQFLLQGLPKANASGEYISKWLDAMAKAQEVNAKLADRKASWASANGNLGTARRDIEIGGVMVPRGTSFAQFMAQVGASDSHGKLPGGISALAEKYGR